MELDQLSTDQPVEFTFDIAAKNADNFEESGHDADTSRVEVDVDGEGGVLADVDHNVQVRFDRDINASNKERIIDNVSVTTDPNSAIPMSMKASFMARMRTICPNTAGTQHLLIAT